MNHAFLEYYRCPESLADFKPAKEHSTEIGSGYFRFGEDNICYGRAGALTCDSPDGTLADAARKVWIEGSTCMLPFNPDEVAGNLRYERYVERTSTPGWKSLVRRLYYTLRPLLPVAVRRHMQKAWLSGWDEKPFPRWPVDTSVDQLFEMLMRLALAASPEQRIPFVWFWPEGKSSAAIMTHDVETGAGLKFAPELMDINDSFGIKSSFQLIPGARYVVDRHHLSLMKGRGFEVNVHDLKHDGHLFDEERSFRKAAAQINRFGIAFGSSGFRSAILYRNQEWYDALHFSYDMSVPNVGHLDPQRGGCCTVMPYFVGDVLELPVTATQDYTLFHVLGAYSLDLWRRQIELIKQRHGLISFIIHPDYLDSSEARKAYTSLLAYLSELRSNSGVWIALPGEVDTWWRQRSAMTVVPDGDSWRIDGAGSERATLAYATLKDNELHYEFA